MRAIVLARRDIREHDQMISFYTREEGKLDVLARGVKKMTSKNSAHLEPFSVIDATIERGKEIDHLTKVYPVQYFADIRKRWEKSAAAGIAVHLTNRFLHTKERDPQLFELLFSWLTYVERISTFVPLFLDGYILRFLVHLGFHPTLHECSVCGTSFEEIAKEEIRSGRKGCLSPAQGGILCFSCRMTEEVSEGDRVAGIQEISTLHLMVQGDWRGLETVAMDQEEETIVHFFVYHFFLFHTETKVADWMDLFRI